MEFKREIIGGERMKKFFELLAIFILCLLFLFTAGVMVRDLYHITISWNIKVNILVDFVSIIICILLAIIFFMIFKDEVKG
jgi:uncharacterized membrane protein YhaH (DUF805 family)